MNKVWNMAQKK